MVQTSLSSSNLINFNPVRVTVVIFAAMRFLFLLMIGSIALSSCFDRGDCLDVSSNLMILKFYKYSNKKALKIKMDSVLLTGWEAVMYKKSPDSLSQVTLPLNYATNSAEFHFYYESQHAILTVDYAHRTFALAPNCNAVDYLTIQNATSEIIRDSKILTPDLTKNATENIKLYF